MTKVVVLLSTWNGSRYLPAQIESLLAQQFVGDLAILIRDDGSADDTAAYIKGLHDGRIRFIQGENLGAKGSFFELLRLAKEEDADYFALCDQDDVWHPDKIRRAISLLGKDSPALYASSVNLVDASLNYIGNYCHPGDRSFVSTLTCNFVTGCTCVFNRLFLDWMPLPTKIEETIMHDWWLASVATLGQRIVYDRDSFISYRQHAYNHVGIRTGFVATLLKLRKVIWGESTVSRFDHARQFLMTAENHFSDEQRKIITDFLAGRNSWLHRIKFSVRHWGSTGLVSAIRFVLFP